MESSADDNPMNRLRLLKADPTDLIGDWWRGIIRWKPVVTAGCYAGLARPLGYSNLSIDAVTPVTCSSSRGVLEGEAHGEAK